jgi:hypothetical protein
MKMNVFWDVETRNLIKLTEVSEMPSSGLYQTITFQKTVFFEFSATPLVLSALRAPG